MIVLFGKYANCFLKLNELVYKMSGNDQKHPLKFSRSQGGVPDILFQIHNPNVIFNGMMMFCK